MMLSGPSLGKVQILERLLLIHCGPLIGSGTSFPGLGLPDSAGIRCLFSQVLLVLSRFSPGIITDPLIVRQGIGLDSSSLPRKFIANSYFPCLRRFQSELKHMSLVLMKPNFLARAQVPHCGRFLRLHRLYANLSCMGAVCFNVLFVPEDRLEALLCLEFIIWDWLQL